MRKPTATNDYPSKILSFRFFPPKMSFNTTLSFGKTSSTFTLNKSGRKWELTVSPGDAEAKKTAKISFNDGRNVVEAGQSGSAKFWAAQGIAFYWHIPFAKDETRAYKISLNWNAEAECFDIEVGENASYEGVSAGYRALTSGVLTEGENTLRFSKLRAPRAAASE